MKIATEITKGLPSIIATSTNIRGLKGKLCAEVNTTTKMVLSQRCDGTSNKQLFQFQMKSNFQYFVKIPALPNMVLSVNNKEELYFGNPDNSNNQLWFTQNSDEGYMQIVNVGLQKAMNIEEEVGKQMYAVGWANSEQQWFTPGKVPFALKSASQCRNECGNRGNTCGKTPCCKTGAWQYCVTTGNVIDELASSFGSTPYKYACQTKIDTKNRGVYVNAVIYIDGCESFQY